MDQHNTVGPEAMTLLIDLAQAGVTARLQGETVLVSPARLVGLDLQERIRQNKQDLVRLLEYDHADNADLTPAQRCHAIIWRYAWYVEADLIARDETAPDEVCLQAARFMAERIKAQLDSGYFPGGRFVQQRGRWT